VGILFCNSSLLVSFALLLSFKDDIIGTVLRYRVEDESHHSLVSFVSSNNASDPTQTTIGVLGNVFDALGLHLAPPEHWPYDMITVFHVT
jgi:hypothetical protein